jgi:hypothetical protein
MIDASKAISLLRVITFEPCTDAQLFAAIREARSLFTGKPYVTPWIHQRKRRIRRRKQPARASAHNPSSGSL